MILLGLGANIPSAKFGVPRDTLEAALAMIEEAGVSVLARSRWYTSAPETPAPGEGQEWYTNGVAALDTDSDAGAVLAVLMNVERRLGRVRAVRNEARVIDLDLLAYGDLVIDQGPDFIVPHPRMHLRSFVLLPLAEVAPGWRHPQLGVTVEALIGGLPSAGLAMPI